jgi:hypothetical protein
MMASGVAATAWSRAFGRLAPPPTLLPRIRKSLLVVALIGLIMAVPLTLFSSNADPC